MKQNFKFKNLTDFKEIYLTCIRLTGAGNNISFCDKMFPLFRTALLLTEESEELDSLFWLAKQDKNPSVTSLEDLPSPSKASSSPPRTSSGVGTVRTVIGSSCTRQPCVTLQITSQAPRAAPSIEDALMHVCEPFWLKPTLCIFRHG